MGDILPFVPRKPDRLGRALASSWRDSLPTDVVLTCCCCVQEFLLLPTGQIFCAGCGCESSNYKVVST